jgi:hypothetical protein
LASLRRFQNPYLKIILPAISSEVECAYRQTRPAVLHLADKDDLYILVSREGYLLGVAVERLPFTIEEIFRLNKGDYVVESFILGQEPSLLVVTQNGKVIHRDGSWIEPAEALKSKGQALYSKQRREGGVRVAGAAMVNEDNWCGLLTSDGKFIVYKVEDLYSAGAIPIREDGIEILGVAVF